MCKKLKESYALKGKKGTPPIRERIIAVVNEVRRLTGKEDIKKEEEKEEMMYTLRKMAREIKAVCSVDGVATLKVWKELEIKHQLYYALMLEQRASHEGIYIMHCKKQWAARALLAKTFKTSCDNEQRRLKKVQTRQTQARSV